jgi:hypothetical protein
MKRSAADEMFGNNTERASSPTATVVGECQIEE